MNGGRQDQTPGTISWGREKAPENSCGEGRSLDKKKKKESLRGPERGGRSMRLQSQTIGDWRSEGQYRTSAGLGQLERVEPVGRRKLPGQVGRWG